MFAEPEQNNEKVVSKEAETAAAIKIQAAYRGHKVRMDLRKADDNSSNLLPESEAELEGKRNFFTVASPSNPLLHSNDNRIYVQRATGVK